MWETIKDVLTGSNAVSVLIFLAFIVMVFIFSSKKGLIAVKTGNLRIGSNEKELSIVRNQQQWSHLFIMSIKGKVLKEDATKEQKKTAELILEKVYDKVIEWIVYNHIVNTNSYIEIKQSEIKCLVYSQDDLDDDFKTPEFATRMEGWTKEVIMNLINIRKEYSQQ